LGRLNHPLSAQTSPSQPPWCLHLASIHQTVSLRLPRERVRAYRYSLPGSLVKKKKKKKKRSRRIRGLSPRYSLALVSPKRLSHGRAHTPPVQVGASTTLQPTDKSARFLRVAVSFLDLSRQLRPSYHRREHQYRHLHWAHTFVR
jgi:hypothetical protein